MTGAAALGSPLAVLVQAVAYEGESDGLGIATGKASSRGHPSHFTYGLYGVLLCCTDITLLVFMSTRRQKKQSQGAQQATKRYRVVSQVVSTVYSKLANQICSLFELSGPRQRMDEREERKLLKTDRE